MKCPNKAEEETVEINNISEEDRLKHDKSSWFNFKEVTNSLPK
jgi:hypothetical protein